MTTTCSPIILVSLVEICDNGIDDDLDGLVDCNDSDCTFENDITPVDESCVGANDGSASVSNSKGGEAPFSYAWSSGSSTDSESSLAPGNYSLTTTDANTCSAITSFTIGSTVCIEICNNSIDDDGDGLIDCNDEDCPKASAVVRINNP